MHVVARDDVAYHLEPVQPASHPAGVGAQAAGRVRFCRAWLAERSVR